MVPFQNSVRQPSPTFKWAITVSQEPLVFGLTYTNFMVLITQNMTTWVSFWYYTPTHREGAILQSPCPSIRLSVCPSVCPSIHLSVRSHFRNRYISFYWKKWLHIYFLFTVRLTNERVGIFLARRSVQHLVPFNIDMDSRGENYSNTCIMNEIFLNIS